MVLTFRDRQLVASGRRLGFTDHEIARDIRAVHLPEVVSLTDILNAIQNLS